MGFTTWEGAGVRSSLAGLRGGCEGLRGSWEGFRGSWEGLGVSRSAPEAAGRALEGKGGRKDNENEGNKVNG